MLNQELELSLNMAFARAREHRHEFMTVEHLLLALLSNPSAREALEACSVDLVALRQELEAFIEQTTPVEFSACTATCGLPCPVLRSQ